MKVKLLGKKKRGKSVNFNLGCKRINLDHKLMGGPYVHTTFGCTHKIIEKKVICNFKQNER